MSSASIQVAVDLPGRDVADMTGPFPPPGRHEMVKDALAEGVAHQRALLELVRCFAQIADFAPNVLSEINGREVEVPAGIVRLGRGFTLVAAPKEKEFESERTRLRLRNSGRGKR